jgi:LAO/AO transport system kinase
LISHAEAGGANAERVDRLVFGHPGNAWVIGIVGAPGVGKSTLTGQLVAAAAGGQPTTAAPRIAVIAVDPSSPVTGGAILGDRVRMDAIAAAHGVFVRSMAHRGATGGLAHAVPIAIRVLIAAGAEVIVVETVGVGQVELEVAMVADTTVAVMSAGWGDAMQAAKAGLLEVADILVVNKADQPGARAAQRDLEQMLDLGAATRDAPASAAWRPPVLATVAPSGEGVELLWSAIGAHRAWLEATGELEGRRLEHIRHEIRGRALVRVTRRLDALMAVADIPSTTDTPGEWARRLDHQLRDAQGIPEARPHPQADAPDHARARRAT